MRTLGLIVMLALISACNSVKKTDEVNKGSALTAKTINVNDSSLKKITSLVDEYEKLRDAFIDYNISKVDSVSNALIPMLDSSMAMRIEDAAISDSVKSGFMNMQAAAKSISSKTNLEDKKRSFSELSDAFYTVLSKMQYNSSVIYKQTCPMAFNDNETASWISRSSEINNPYLGKMHPKYAAGMLHCGEVTDSVAYKK